MSHLARIDFATFAHHALGTCQEFQAREFLNNHEKGAIDNFETFTSDVIMQIFLPSGPHRTLARFHSHSASTRSTQ